MELKEIFDDVNQMLRELNEKEMTEYYANDVLAPHTTVGARMAPGALRIKRVLTTLLACTSKNTDYYQQLLSCKEHFYDPVQVERRVRITHDRILRESYEGQIYWDANPSWR